MSQLSLPPLVVTWPDHHQVMVDALWNLWNENYKVDVEMSCNGHVTKSHQLILAMFLPGFKEIMKQKGDRFVSLDGVVENGSEIGLLVEFIYRGKVMINEDRLESLLVLAQILNFKELANALERCRKELLSDKSETRLKADSGLLENADGKVLEHGNTCSEDASTIKNERRKASREHQQKVKGLKSHTEELTKSVHVHENCESQPFKSCANCSFRSRCQDVLELHKNKHDSNFKRYKCDTCGKRFAGDIGYKKHLLIHGNRDNLFNCTHCDFHTTDSSRLIVHLNVCHKIDGSGNPVTARFKCDHCDFIAVNRVQLSSHATRKHNQKNSYKCDECEYTANTHQIIDRHVSMVHRNERPYMCDVCGARLKSLNHFQEHMRAHAGLKPHKCHICNKAFARATSLNAHLRLHSGVPRLVCGVCGSGFQKRYRFAAHLERQHNLIFDPEKWCRNKESFVYPCILTEKQDVNIEKHFINTENSAESIS